jgi:hypothetical protein
MGSAVECTTMGIVTYVCTWAALQGRQSMLLLLESRFSWFMYCGHVANSSASSADLAPRNSLAALLYS